VRRRVKRAQAKGPRPGRQRWPTGELPLDLSAGGFIGWLIV
jgi:hypothetical protein